MVLFNTFKELRDTNGKVKIKSKSNKIESIELNDTFFEPIPFKELIKQIKVEVKYSKDIEGDFVIEDMEYYYISLPEIIRDGTKHKLYTRIVNALYFINGNITRSQVLSYIFYVNNRANPGMNLRYLYNFITRLCDNIEQNGAKVKPRIKRIHFNNESNLTKKQKQIMAAKINGKIKTNRTREIIQNAKYELAIRNEKVTQVEVVRITGLSIATVKRNWNKQIDKVIDVEVPILEEPILTKPILNEIEEDEFFDEKEIIDYKGIKKVEIDKVTQEDKRLFISKINALFNMGLEPSESLMLDLKIFDQYKTWYLYTKWRKTNKYKNI